MGSRSRNVLDTAGSPCSACCLQTELKLPVLFTAWSRYFFVKNSQSCLFQESKLPVLFTAGSQKSLCFLPQRFTVTWGGVNHENLNNCTDLFGDNLDKTHLWVLSTSHKDKFEWLKKGFLRVSKSTPSSSLLRGVYWNKNWNMTIKNGIIFYA